jgi:hypothetical protein
MPAQKDTMTDNVKRMVEPMKIELDQITRTKSIFNANQVQKIFNTTNAKYKYTRPAKGGGVWQYVRTSYIRRTLDGLFGFNWDFEILTPDETAFQMAAMTGVVSVRGRLTGRTKDTEGVWHTVVREQYGRAEVKWQMEAVLDDFGKPVKDSYGKPKKTRKIDEWSGKPLPLDFGNDLKAATSDALKKCAAQFGIAADVYDPDEFIPYEVTGSDEASKRTATAKQLAADAKKKAKAIDAAGTEVAPPTK